MALCRCGLRSCNSTAGTAGSRCAWFASGSARPVRRSVWNALLDDEVPVHFEERAAFLWVGYARLDRDRVAPGRRPAPGEQDLAWLPHGRAGHVLPDPSAVECLDTVDEHARVARLAANSADRADDRDRAARDGDSQFAPG